MLPRAGWFVSLSQREWGHRKFVLDRETETHAARDKDLQQRTGREEVGDYGRRRHHLLEVIEHEKEVLVA